LPVALLALGCGQSSREQSEQGAPPPLEQSPIVFGSYGPPGTFFITYEDRAPKYVNDNYDFYPISLSPSRTHVLQATEDPEGNPDRVVEIFPIRENAPLLRRVPVPAWQGFLGWSGDDTVVFSMPDTEGVLRLGVDGSRSVLPFANDVARRGNIAPGSLSPDGATAAFVVIGASDVASSRSVLITIDTRTGAELDRWSIWWISPLSLVYWANDGAIVLLSRSNRELYSFVSGDEAVRDPVELPFQPCGVSNWVEPGTVFVTEAIAGSDNGSCGNSWIVSTDGSSALRREGPAPVAFSADQQKILLLDSGILSVADPDGSNVEQIEGLPSPHNVVW
jgi:hypothetical protein